MPTDAQTPDCNEQSAPSIPDSPLAARRLRIVIRGAASVKFNFDGLLSSFSESLAPFFGGERFPQGTLIYPILLNKINRVIVRRNGMNCPYDINSQFVTFTIKLWRDNTATDVSTVTIIATAGPFDSTITRVELSLAKTTSFRFNDIDPNPMPPWQYLAKDAGEDRAYPLEVRHLTIDVEGDVTELAFGPGEVERIDVI